MKKTGKEDRFMKRKMKQLGIALTFALCMLVSACSAQQKESDPCIIPVKPTEQENLIASAVEGRSSIFHFQYSDEIKERKIYLEEWVQGKKTKTVLLLNGETDKTEQMAVVTTLSQAEDKKWDGITYRLAVQQPELGTLITPEPQTISFPTPLKAVAYSSLEEKESLLTERWKIRNNCPLPTAIMRLLCVWKPSGNKRYCSTFGFTYFPGNIPEEILRQVASILR